MRIQKLTLIIDNSTQHLHYPFSYQPDPIISNIEPTESFLAGGRLILVTGQHLSSPQTIRLIVYHEHRPNIINATACSYQNDTLVTCLTPAISRQLLVSSLIGQQQQQQQQMLISDDEAEQMLDQQLSYEMGGLKLKMSLFMDDVKSVRNLDEYYHHLPHYMTYYQDPVLFKLAQQVIDYASLQATDNTVELILRGENLKMRQLDQDMLITVGNLICPIKSLSANQVVCEPPPRIAPIYRDSTSQSLIEQPILPIIALIGSNLRYHLGHVQYHSRQYQFSGSALNTNTVVGANGEQQQQPLDAFDGGQQQQSTAAASFQQPTGAQVLLSLLSFVAILTGVAVTTVFGLAKFRQSKAEREYKRIQLQMGALEAAGSGLFDHTSQSRHWSYMTNTGSNNNNNNSSTIVGRNCVVSPGKQYQQKLLYHLPLGPQFGPPASPQTDLSPMGQHFVKLASNGTSVTSSSQQPVVPLIACQQNYTMTSCSTASSSPNSNHRLASLATTSASASTTTAVVGVANSHQHEQGNNLLISGSNTSSSSVASSQHNGADQQQQAGGYQPSSWLQDAPTTVLPYAVIEACKLATLDARQGRKYV